MKRNLIVLLALFSILAASAQKATYKIIERKRGTAYTPYMIGADSDYVYVHVPGISESYQSRNTDASLSIYRTKDFTLAKKIEADFDYDGEDVFHASAALQSKYVLMTYRVGSKKTKIENHWVALEKGTLKPVKKGAFSKNLEAEGDTLPLTIVLSPDRKTTVMVTGYKERKLPAAYEASCYDEDMNLLWEAKFELPDADCRAEKMMADNNHNFYLLTKTKPESFASAVAQEYRLLSLKNGGKTKDTKNVELAGRYPFAIDMQVSGGGDIYIGGGYSLTSDLAAEGIFSMKISAQGTATSDIKTIQAPKSKGGYWYTVSSLTEQNEFCFASTRYVTNSFENRTTSYIGEYVAVYTDAAGKINHQMQWHHYYVPGGMDYAQTVVDGRPYLFTEYAQEQLDDWGKKHFSVEETSIRDRTDPLMRMICQVPDVDHPDAKKPRTLFHLEKSFFTTSAHAYVPSIKTMVFFGYVTKGQYAQGWTNFFIGKAPLNGPAEQ